MDHLTRSRWSTNLESRDVGSSERLTFLWIFSCSLTVHKSQPTHSLQKCQMQPPDAQQRAVIEEGTPKMEEFDWTTTFFKNVDFAPSTSTNLRKNWNLNVQLTLIEYSRECNRIETERSAISSVLKSFAHWESRMEHALAISASPSIKYHLKVVLWQFRQTMGPLYV